MKETDDMSLFVFSSRALNQVNTVMPMTPEVGGTWKKTRIQQRGRTWLWDESSTHHTQVFAHHQSKQTPEVKRNKGAASKTSGCQLMPRKTDWASPACCARKTGLLLWEWCRDKCWAAVWEIWLTCHLELEPTSHRPGWQRARTDLPPTRTLVYNASLLY